MSKPTTTLGVAELREFAVLASVRYSSHWGRSPQDGLRDEQTCGTILASAYVLYCLSATWSQLQMMGKSLR